MDSKINQTHIGKQIQTTIGSNHLETQIFDQQYIDGAHCLKFGAILQESTADYRLYYSFDGVGIDLIKHNIHIILTTTNFGTPFHQYTWLFIGQDAIRNIFSKETILEEHRIRISDRMMKENGESIATFHRHITKVIQADI
ncbi:MAG: hypothetical protein Q9M16_05830 [Mariprofundus sp.]|nr:hypothetical protein [Mariprofundus sp.]